MATMLESYIAQKNGFDAGVQVSMPGPGDILRQQELLYRVEVLEACQIFVKTAPRGADTNELCWHYQIVDAYLHNLALERRLGAAADERLLKQRDSAHGNLLRVIQDYRKRFGSFTPGSDSDAYQKAIKNVIQTVLPVWIQYRQTFTEIPKEAQ
jgi:hypothetical protein